MKFERDELVRGSHLSLVCNAHTTAGDVVSGADKASVKITFGYCCVENRYTNTLKRLPTDKKKLFERI